MRNDFGVMILTYKRPDNQKTFRTIRNCGYTGKVFFVVDDQDPTLGEYQKRYGKSVLVFSKQQYAEQCDEGDNSGDRRTVLYARNASFDLAKAEGLKFFVQLDDDYGSFYYRFNEIGQYGSWKITDLDKLFSLICVYLARTPFSSIALSQGGDHIGGGAASVNSFIRTRRKAMNSFFCDVDRSFKFSGRLNDDVNTVITEQRKGRLFLTLMSACLNQAETQAQTGGLTDLYLDSGTYVKSFYSVMFEPSTTKVSVLSSSTKDYDGHPRIHHKINWNACAPCIIEERYKK